MKIEKFIADMAEAIEMDQASLSVETEYKELGNWDSLAALSMIAMIDDSYNVSIGGDDLEKTNTVKDLWELVGKRKS
jgi:acyl carrier protein